MYIEYSLKELMGYSPFYVMDKMTLTYKHNGVYLYCMYQFVKGNRKIKEKYPNDKNSKLRLLTLLKDINPGSLESSMWLLNRTLKEDLGKENDKAIKDLFNYAYENKDKTNKELLDMIADLYNKLNKKADDKIYRDYRIMALKLLLKERNGITDDLFFYKLINRLNNSKEVSMELFKEFIDNLNNCGNNVDSYESFIYDPIDRKVFKRLSIKSIEDFLKMNPYQISLLIDYNMDDIVKTVYINHFRENDEHGILNYMYYLVRPYKYTLISKKSNDDFITECAIDYRENRIKEWAKKYVDLEEARKTILRDIKEGLEIVDDNKYIIDDLITCFNKKYYDSNNFTPLSQVLNSQNNSINRGFLYEIITSGYSKIYRYSKAYDCIVPIDTKDENIEKEFIKSFKPKSTSLIAYGYKGKLREIFNEYYEENVEVIKNPNNLDDDNYFEFIDDYINVTYVLKKEKIEEINKIKKETIEE